VLTTVSVQDLPVAAHDLAHRVVPNPFNPITRIEFTLPSPAIVSLRVYNVAGQLVRTLAAGEKFDAGPNTIAWDGVTESGKQSASGLYFYRIETRFGIAQGKLVLIK
jgi:flagellar hook assembly protein FlgD